MRGKEIKRLFFLSFRFVKMSEDNFRLVLFVSFPCSNKSTHFGENTHTHTHTHSHSPTFTRVDASRAIGGPAMPRLPTKLAIRPPDPACASSSFTTTDSSGSGGVEEGRVRPSSPACPACVAIGGGC